LGYGTTALCDIDFVNSRYRNILTYLLTYLLTYFCKLLVGTEGLLKTVSFKKIMEDM